MTLVTDQMFILEVYLTTGETKLHTYPIPPYGDTASVNKAVEFVQEVMDEVKKILSGEARMLLHPSIAYNPAHVVRVKVDGQNATDILKQIPADKRPLGFATL